MPVARGRPLRAMIDEAPLTVSDAVRLTHEVAEALAYLHETGYVHRDVKPENIMVEGGHAVLTDFGVATSARAVAARAESSLEEVANAAVDGTRMTQAGKAVGTLQYMSPETLRGDTAIDGRSDVYALGLVLLVVSVGAAVTLLRARQAIALDPNRVVVADLANDAGDSTLSSIGPIAGDYVHGSAHAGDNAECSQRARHAGIEAAPASAGGRLSPCPADACARHGCARRTRGHGGVLAARKRARGGCRGDGYAFRANHRCRRPGARQRCASGCAASLGSHLLGPRSRSAPSRSSALPR